MEIDFDSVLTDTFADIAAFIPKFVGFLLVFIIGSFVAKWLRRLVAAGLKRLRFDEYIDRAGMGAPLERAGFRDSGKFLAQVIYYLVMLLVLKLALSSFGQNDISEALDGLIAFIPNLIVAIAIIVITGVIANAVGNLLRPMLAQVDYGSALARVATASIWVLGGFAALDQVEFAQDIVDTLFTALVGSLGLILVIKFGVGGIWAARDHFWPAVYRKLGSDSSSEQA